MSVAIMIFVIEILLLAMSGRISRELGWKQSEMIAAVCAIVAFIAITMAVVWLLAIWAGQSAPDFKLAPLALVGALNIIPALRANALATGRAK